MVRGAWHLHSRSTIDNFHPLDLPEGFLRINSNELRICQEGLHLMCQDGLVQFTILQVFLNIVLDQVCQKLPLNLARGLEESGLTCLRVRDDRELIADLRPIALVVNTSREGLRIKSQVRHCLHNLPPLTRGSAGACRNAVMLSPGLVEETPADPELMGKLKQYVRSRSFRSSACPRLRSPNASY